MKTITIQAHETIITEVEELTNSVLNWFGFTRTEHYRLRPYAMRVAIELYQRGHRADTLTQHQIEQADLATKGRMTAMWLAMQSPEVVVDVRRYCQKQARIFAGSDSPTVRCNRILDVRGQCDRASDHVKE
jgi:hypothetical protein